MAGIIPNLAPATGDRASSAQVIDGSLKFNDDKGTHLKKRQGTDGDRRRWTWSGWVKQNTLSTSAQVFVGGPDDADRTIIRLTSSNKLEVEEYSSGSYQFQYATEQLFRDVSGFMHICVNYDSRNSVAVDRVRVYVNGRKITAFSTYNDASQNFAGRINSATTHFIGRHAPSSTQYLDANLSQVYFLDGQSLGPGFFGFNDPLTNTWRPKKLTRNDTGVNDGSVWSSSSTNWTDPAQAFNGVTGNYAEVSSSSAKGTFTFPKTIQVQNSVTFRFNSGTSGNLFINDTAIAMQGTGAQTQRILFNGPLNSISLQSGSQPVLWYFSVDDEVLVDKKITSAAKNPNDGRTWSDGIDSTRSGDTADKGFDGNPASNAAVNDTDMDWTVSLYDVKSMAIRCREANGSGSATLTVSGTGISDLVIPATQTGELRQITVTSPNVSNLTITTSSQGSLAPGIAEVVVNGYTLIDDATDNSFYLPMDGSAPIGHDIINQNPINNGTVWSNVLTSSGSFATSPSLGFDGIIDSSNECRSGSGDTLTFTPPGGINYTSKVEIYNQSASNRVILNGGSPVSMNTYGVWHTIATGSGTINTMAMNDTAGNSFAFGGIRVDGVVLVDGIYGNGFKPVNFGGSNSLEKATGALPILNTTQGGTVAGVGNFGSNVSKVIAVTVSNASGSNKYYFDSVLNPTLPLIRGSIISFDTSDSSNDSHPFKLSSTNADSSGGTEYTDGVAYFVNGSQKNASDYVSQYSSHSSGFRGIKWTVPHDVSTTYYYCTSHTGMGNNGRLNSTTDVTKADPFAWKCFLALPLNVPSIDQSSTLNRTSSGKAITVSGCVASSDQSNFYGRSTFFDGSNDQLSVEAHGQMAFGADDDWTFEVWFYTTTVGSSWAISDYSGNNSASGDPGGQIYFSASSGAGLHWYQNSTRYAEIPKEEIQANKWHHVAFVKDGTADTITSFLDGVVKTTDHLDDTSGSSSGGLIIGQQGGGTFFSGYMSDFRVYKGIKKYTTNFIPAATNPDILPDTPSGVSVKSKLTEITEGAVAFDGADGNGLIVADSTDFDHASAFTWEGYFYLKSYDSSGVSVVRHENDGLDWYINTSGNIIFNQNPSTGLVNTGNGVMVLNKWVHIAISHTGSVCKLFVDGIERASATTSTVPDNVSGNLHIGESGDNENYQWNGFISNLRFVNGTALYTSNFTPPTEPLTNVTNTKLLTCQSPTRVRFAPVAPNVGVASTAVFNSNFESIPTAVDGLTVTNNSSVSTTSAGTNSYGFTNVASFNGSNSLSVNLGAIPQVSTYDIIFKTTGSTDNKYLFAISNTGLVRRGGSSLAWYNNSADQVLSTTPDDRKWHHLRVTPKSLYFDGVETKTTSTTPNIYVSSNGYMALGAYRNDSGTIQYNGEIDIGLVKVHRGVDLGAPTSYPITTNGTLSSSVTTPDDGVIFAAANSTATAFNPFNTDIHTVRGQETVYPTWNPLVGSTSTFSDGNLQITTQASGYVIDSVTMRTPAGTGRWYWEFVQTARTGTDYTLVGMLPDDNTYRQTTSNIPQDCNGIGIYIGQNGVTYAASGAATTGTTTATFDVGDVLGWAYDAEAGTVECYKNGVPQGTQFTNVRTDTGWTFCVTDYDNTTVSTFEINFGQKPFKYAPPEGFQSLNLASTRPEKVISNPAQYVGIVTYMGNDTSASRTLTPAETNLQFTPDLIWQKSRNNTNWHGIHDSVRGGGNTLYPNDSSQNTSNNQYGYISSFIHRGFVWTAGSTNNSDGNQANSDFVSWCWKAGGNRNTFNVDDVGYSTAAAAGMSAGALNSSSAVYDASQTWRNYMSNSSGAGNLFDGDLSTFYGPDGNPQTFIPDTAIKVNRKLEIYYKSGSASRNASVNNGSAIATGIQSNGKWVDLQFTGMLREISVTNGWNVSAIRVDGKILVDDDITPENRPLIAPSGASAGTKQGFSIITYAGTNDARATIPTGLNEETDFAIVKATNQAYNWYVYHSSLSPANRMKLDTTDAQASDNSGFIYRDGPGLLGLNRGSSLGNNVNASTINYVAYCWHDVPGLQKFGSFEGNESNDGPFVELGFRPALILLRNIDNSGTNYDWCIYDNTRSKSNPNDKFLCPNLNENENDRGDGNSDNARYVDFLSNGFKIRNNSSALNLNSHTIIYAAWAEAPAMSLYGGQPTAR